LGILTCCDGRIGDAVTTQIADLALYAARTLSECWNEAQDCEKEKAG
jgi:hypothetical protein